MSNKIQSVGLDKLLGDRFGRYSKYIIQDRALPDVRDGLKPVQRRILFAMYKDGNMYQNAYRKSAKTIGNVIGNYHPHGDSSVYEAMTRLSQTWKVKHPLVDMHGNNGSIDGDPAAAMRYTEARLSNISGELLRDIDKQTVDFIPNFDDTMLEPTVLPARIPLLLINGATGISAGYATDIPPHNILEVIDGAIYVLNNRRVSDEQILEIIKGPDFPTGGIATTGDGLKDALTTGKGKVTLRSKFTIELIGGKEVIVISEIPYEVNKASLVRKIDEIRVDKLIDGINEVRDESDRDGLQISIELKKGFDAQLILNYLLKNTELQINYNYNMISIANGHPLLLGVKEMLQYYVEFQISVLTRRSQFDLKNARRRSHILEGLIKAISVLDEVISIIRSSKNKSDAKENLIQSFDFSIEQAEAIVMLQLYRLTNTDILTLTNEHNELASRIKELEKIINDEKYLRKILTQELLDIREKLKDSGKRKTMLTDKTFDVKVDQKALQVVREGVVTITRDGYVKFASLRSFTTSKENGVKELDIILTKVQTTSDKILIAFTQTGMYYYLPLHVLPETKWKDVGNHIGQFIKGESDGKIIFATIIDEKDKQNIVTTVTKNGMIKRSFIEDFHLQRYKKQGMAMKLKEGDEVIDANISLTDGISVILTHRGLGLTFYTGDIPIIGLKSRGVIAIKLSTNDFVSCSGIFHEDDDFVITSSRGIMKRLSLKRLSVGNRANKGQLFIKQVKSNPIIPIGITKYEKGKLLNYFNNDAFVSLPIPDLPIADFTQQGVQVVDHEVTAIYSVNTEEISKELSSDDTIDVAEQLKKIQKNYTIDDFIK